jgi:hypothetical protein
MARHTSSNFSVTLIVLPNNALGPVSLLISEFYAVVKGSSKCLLCLLVCPVKR